MKIEEKIEKYFNNIQEANVKDMRLKANKAPEQTPGEKAINFKGETIPHSVALNETDTAYIKNGDLRLTLSSGIGDDMFIVTLQKQDVDNLKKIL